LRDKLNQDTQILASLDPNSDTYRRLAARVERQTADLLDYEDQREQRRHATQRALTEQRHRDQRSETRITGGIGIVIGAIVTTPGGARGGSCSDSS
jgi:hypothetical protein